MLDLLTIFSKGGIVLWCFQSTPQLFAPSVNALVKSVILQERGGGNRTFSHGNLTLKYKLDNEFELVFVVAYQKILQLSYIDKFITDIHREFRDKYKDDLQNKWYFGEFNFGTTFKRILAEAEEFSKREAKVPQKMKKFQDSEKSKKTVNSMIVKSGDAQSKEAAAAKEPSATKQTSSTKTEKEAGKLAVVNGNGLDEETLKRNREKLFNKVPKKKPQQKMAGKPGAKKSKEARTWEMGGTHKDVASLDFSGANNNGNNGDAQKNGSADSEHDVNIDETKYLVGKMRGQIQDMDYISEDEEEVAEEEEVHQPEQAEEDKKKGGKSGYSMFSMFQGLVGAKSLTRGDIQPALDKMRDHLIGKNVAADIADKLCESVATKLEGKVLGTFKGVQAEVKATLQDSLMQILSPSRRLDILRDVVDTKSKQRPYVVTFCGVNGVGKSTNLAKICFWLIENGHSVLIAACDTFRAGAVEQLRTHTRHLNALHPPPQGNSSRQMVQLYEKGYGKDAAGIAMEAINFARDTHVDVVLVDTAGRMQDNEPLMRSLAKLIKVNQPDLVLFVGEALVGNEAVDQLTKFNQALADHSNMSQPRLIDGIVLTKFDTIDDKVGAAISMTYITGQPIVFVGTGQTYTDLKALNARAVAHALIKV